MMVMAETSSNDLLDGLLLLNPEKICVLHSLPCDFHPLLKIDKIDRPQCVRENVPEHVLFISVSFISTCRGDFEDNKTISVERG